jgi:hypothetical protein
MNSGSVTIHLQNHNGIYLLTSPGCSTGASIVVMPSTAASVAKAAHARDGRLAAVVLATHQARFRVEVDHADGGHVTVDVDLQNFQPGQTPAPTRT